MYTPKPHPILPVPTAAQAMEHGQAWWAERMAQREQIIKAEKADPFSNQWEPPIWKVCDALLGLPWVDRDYARQMREHLGFPRPIRVLMLNGGNRASKSQYAASRCMRILRVKSGSKVWACHESLDRSHEDMQPLFFNYLPPQLKLKDIKTRTTYIAYKRKTGFSDNRFVLPPPKGGNFDDCPICTFLAYGQNDDTIEGGELDVVWMDELFPPFWQRTMPLRVATRNGFILETFTPVRGYSETVANRHDGAEVVKDSIAYLLPADGGSADVPRALGLNAEQYAEIQSAEHADLGDGVEGRRASWSPQSIPEQCDEWLAGGTGQPACPPDREFHKVPRILKCADPEEQTAVVFFHSSDNPYGNPKAVWARIAGGAEDYKKERFYGVATKLQGKRFTRYDEKVHVIDDDEIPAEGDNYLILDPSNGRNIFMAWFRVTKSGSYLYREWPSSYSIPGQGVPGPWAEPDGKYADGRRGPGQTPFGWSLLEYKREIARLEQWAAYTQALEKHGGPLAIPIQEVAAWDELGEAGEDIQERFMDSRYASNPKLEKDRTTTPLEDFHDIGLNCVTTPGGQLVGEDGGILMITNLLAYDEHRPVDFLNSPRLRIARSCTNTRFSLRTWTYEDGQKGACKDPIDTLHYFAALNLDPWAPEPDNDEEEESDFTLQEQDTY